MSLMDISNCHWQTIPVGDDIAWGANLFKLINQIDKEYIILFLDDFLLYKSIENDLILELIKYTQKEDLDCLRLRPSPVPSKRVDSVDNIDLGIILPGEPYRISTQVSVWKKSFLKSICIDKMSAWDFELSGSKTVNTIDCKIYGVYTDVIHTDHCIEKGKWLESGVALAKQNGFTPDLSIRPILPEQERVKPVWKKILLSVYEIIPSRIKRKIRLKLLSPD